MITVDNDKNVLQPYVYAENDWQPVKKEAVMVNGEWQTVFEKNGYVLRFFTYGKLLETRIVPPKTSTVFPSAPLVYGGDTKHFGWVKTYGATSSDYIATATIRPTADMDLHALYYYLPTVTVNTIDASYSSTVKQVQNKTIGPETLEIEGVIEVVTKNYNTNEIISTEYRSFDLNTDGTGPYVKINDSYVEGTLGNSEGPTVVSADIVRYDNIYVCGADDMIKNDTLNKTQSTIRYKLIVRYRTYGGSTNQRSSKE